MIKDKNGNLMEEPISYWFGELFEGTLKYDGAWFIDCNGIYHAVNGAAIHWADIECIGTVYDKEATNG